MAHLSPHIQDVSHSVNTLSYAAPFRILPPSRPPGPYDAEDPRTWDHAASIKWLSDAFWEQRMLRREADWTKQDKQAQELGRRLRPAPPAIRQDQNALVDLQQFCPAPQGGIALSRVYGAEWVQKCLQHRNATLAEGKDQDTMNQAIKDDALGVYLAFSQKLVRARTRSRRKIMNSRKIFEYEGDGASPFLPVMSYVENTFYGHKAPTSGYELTLLEKMSEEERLDFLSVYDQNTINRMIYEKRLADGGSSRAARDEVFATTIALFREGVEKAAREKARQDLEMENWDGEWTDFIDVIF